MMGMEMAMVRGLHSVGDRGVNFAIRKINNNSWLIDGKVLLSQPRHPRVCILARRTRRTIFYRQRPASTPSDSTASDTSDITVVYFAGDVSAVVEIGDALFKSFRCRLTFKNDGTLHARLDAQAHLELRHPRCAIPIRERRPILRYAEPRPEPNTEHCMAFNGQENEIYVCGANH